ncbi:Asp-tRNA(Asn)/Glu-tRNA(Gln) amidotransferase subunit GatC [Halobaculum sp. MBLA0147]|uniref:Asp-tRNA(Asn)/Glu-tRNA(Gln) amidotransferase subunit GatC n=1 Tax=Halobaculum sp. MBLA0147 TaxID=3079934 RepID=UPI00352398E2
MSETPDDADAAGDDPAADGGSEAADAASAPSTVAPDDVRHVAELARVALNDEEVATFTDQFGDILEYFDALDEVPEQDAEPELVNVMRADEVRESLSQEAALSNAPESEDGYFVGPRVS